MLILKDRLENMPILSLQTGAQIAETYAFIIDPRQLKVVAFYCKGPRLDVQPAVLTVSDIREVSDIGFIVDSSDVLMAPNDLVRLKEVLDFNFVLDNKLVIDETGKKLGHVQNFTLDAITLYVLKLHVRPGFFQAWANTEFIIDRTQILEVNDHEVVVKSATVKKENKQTVAKPQIIENPFRRPQSEVPNGAHLEK